jgi:hypothetical protein
MFRQLPSDKLLEESENAIAQFSSPSDNCRAIALKMAPTPTEVQYRLWIGAPKLTSSHSAASIINALSNDSQPMVWLNARRQSLLRDFKCIPNSGIGFTCVDYSTAMQLSGLKITLFDHEYRISRFSAFASRYWVDLTRLPDAVTDQMIYDWFVERGAHPTCIIPTYESSGLTSRQRTVYFNQDTVPECISEPLREIIFSDPEDGSQLRPCFVHHRLRSFNKVIPPSIAAARAKARQNHESTSSKAKPTPAFTSSLVASLKEASSSSSNTNIQASHPPQPTDLDESMNASFMEREDSLGLDNFSDISSTDSPSENSALDQNLILLRPNSNTSHWERVNRARRATYGIQLPNTTLHECSPSSTLSTIHEYAFETHPNRFEPLWSEHPLDSSVSDFDLQVWDDDGKLQAFSLPHPSSIIQADVTQATINFNVETMTRRRLFEFIDDFLSQENQSHLDTLTSFYAQPSFHAHNTDPSQDRTQTLSLHHSIFRLILSSEDPRFSSCTNINEQLQAAGASSTSPAVFLSNHARLPDGVSQDQYLLLAWWDLYLQATAPLVYYDPCKIQILTGIPAQYLCKGSIPLLSDLILVRLTMSILGSQLSEHHATPQLVKQNIRSLALLPCADGSSAMIGHLHF